MTDNLLYYGDNLDILRRHVEIESVDLVYLDPPLCPLRQVNQTLKKAPRASGPSAETLTLGP